MGAQPLYTVCVGRTSLIGGDPVDLLYHVSTRQQGRRYPGMRLPPHLAIVWYVPDNSLTANAIATALLTVGRRLN